MSVTGSGVAFFSAGACDALICIGTSALFYIKAHFRGYASWLHQCAMWMATSAFTPYLLQLPDLVALPYS